MADSLVKGGPCAVRLRGGEDKMLPDFHANAYMREQLRTIVQTPESQEVKKPIIVSGIEGLTPKEWKYIPLRRQRRFQSTARCKSSWNFLQRRGGASFRLRSCRRVSESSKCGHVGILMIGALTTNMIEQSAKSRFQCRLHTRFKLGT